MLIVVELFVPTLISYTFGEETAKEKINNALNTARYFPMVETVTVGSVSFTRNPTTLLVRVLKFIVENYGNWKFDFEFILILA